MGWWKWTREPREPEPARPRGRARLTEIDAVEARIVDRPGPRSDMPRLRPRHRAFDDRRIW